ncbi:hypothetical protein DPM13_05025 [Paracoccus mutanolyticus]|uniref:Uncharacterized protein n=1 Tax=Paracoccus mutanolyticus TaxID=1499308 RepID=A0ABN5M578_9RHOB|nr:hypothetical protein [Paracoccus mutanolyticus]AWX92762.1 hypothetical protein DPM13_05025 [Paracoccus mutanolyticus]
MTGPRLAAFAGSWSQPSKTRRLVYAVAADFQADGLHPDLSQRLNRAVGQCAAHLPRHHAAPLRAAG